LKFLERCYEIREHYFQDEISKKAGLLYDIGTVYEFLGKSEEALHKYNDVMELLKNSNEPFYDLEDLESRMKNLYNITNINNN